MSLQARELPGRLLSFFKKHPPPQLLAARAMTAAPQEPSTITVTENTSSLDPNAAATETTVSTELPEGTWPANDHMKRNPFLPFRNPRTNNWHGPVYSLRRQAELYKLAEKHHVLPLMPRSHKHPEVKLQRRAEVAERMEGKRAKGKSWERGLRGRMEVRRQAMEGMPEMVRHWKQRGHGRGLKKWPK